MKTFIKVILAILFIALIMTISFREKRQFPSERKSLTGKEHLKRSTA